MRYATEEDITCVSSSRKGSNTSELITGTFSPGTYYMRVYAYGDNCNDSEVYSLSFWVYYTASNESISALKYNKGAVAAIWLSDYDPCGISPFSSYSKGEIGYRSTSTGGLVADIQNKFENPYLSYFNKSNYIEHASIYIWDVDFRNEIRNYLLEFQNEIESEIDENEQLEMIRRVR